MSLEAVKSKYEIAEIEQAALREVFEENQGAGEIIGPADLPRITLPSGRVRVWELPSIQGPVHIDSFEGILVSWKKNRSYWRNKYSGQGESPNCRSSDGITGIGNPGGLCESCALSKWGENGEPPGCIDQRVLFIVREKNILPLVLIIPPTSIPAMRKLLLNLTNEKLPYWGVVIRFGLEKAESGEGIEFSKLTVSVVRVLDAEERIKVKGYVYLIKNLVQKTHAEPEDYYIKEETTTVIEEEINIEDIEIDKSDIEEIDNEPPIEEPELNRSLMDLKADTAKKKKKQDKEDDPYKDMDVFLSNEDADWDCFWKTCTLLGFNKDYINKYFKTNDIRKVNKKLLDIFLRKSYAQKFGEPRW